MKRQYDIAFKIDAAQQVAEQGYGVPVELHQSWGNTVASLPNKNRASAPCLQSWYR